MIRNADFNESEYVREVESQKIHGDHNPGDSLPEGGKCYLQETILSGTGLYQFWSCGYEERPQRGRKKG